MKSALLLLMMSVASAGSVQEQRPNFSGSWTLDAEKTAAIAPTPDRRYPTTVMEIKMDATTMTVASIGPAGKTQRVFKLDGSASSNNASQTAAVGVESTAAWNGAKLLITTKLYDGNSVLTYSLDGGNLKVEFKGTGNISRAAIYKKVS